MSGAVRHVGVIDIGKTNAKVILYDLDAAIEKDVRSARNTVTQKSPYPHFEVDVLFDFILNALADFQRIHGIDAISITTHGATIAVLDNKGDLALPVLDYEHIGISETDEEYNKIRSPFSTTGSPRLAMGLNIGAQLFWQKKRFPYAFARIDCILPYPQYWAYRLTGRRSSEVTSWGCHSDLWEPHTGSFSGLVGALGLEGKIANLVRADEVLGNVLPEVAVRTGLSSDCPVYAGIHDSNASLLPHLWSRSPPFSVVSTGTWVVVMAVGSCMPPLDENRDTLMNVNAFGDPVPSARFMGGRVFEVSAPKGSVMISNDDRKAMLDDNIMLMPSVLGDTGPFQGITGGWSVNEEQLTPGMQLLGISWYLALMTSICLDLTGAAGPTLVEGPFSDNHDFITMLSAATGRSVEQSSGSGTSEGAAGLVIGGIRSQAFAPRPLILAGLSELNHYADIWHQRLPDVAHFKAAP